MLTAIDTIRETAVTGREIFASDDYDVAAAEENREDPQQTPAGEARIRCLCCDQPLVYNGSAAATPLEWFVHPHEECVSDGNMATAHRLGQEMAAKVLFNLLPTDRTATQIGLERRIDADSGFMIADVRVIKPIQLAVEVVNLSPELHLRRRLQTLFNQGYAGMIVVVTTGQVSAARLERHLSKVGTIRVGRFYPQTLELDFGSVVTPKQVNLQTSVWNSIPAYLS
jgi:hypothetical protein